MHAGLIRKAVHIVLALCFIYIAHTFSLVGVLYVSAAILVLFSALRVTRPTGVFQQVVRTTYGEFFFIGGVVFAAMLFLPGELLAFQTGMLVLGIADPFAALVGVLWGRHQYRVWGEKKTLEGSVACELAAFGIFFTVGIPFLYSIIGGALMALVEAGASRGSDNLLLPVAAGLFVLFV